MQNWTNIQHPVALPLYCDACSTRLAFDEVIDSTWDVECPECGSIDIMIDV